MPCRYLGTLRCTTRSATELGGDSAGCLDPPARLRPPKGEVTRAPRSCGPLLRYDLLAVGLSVVNEAQPANLQGFCVVLVVRLRLWVTANFAGLAD